MEGISTGPLYHGVNIYEGRSTISWSPLVNIYGGEFSRSTM